MKPIKYGSTAKVLLVGNGINLSFDKPSWDKLISEHMHDNVSKEDISSMPYPMQIVVASNDGVDTFMKEYAAVLKAEEISDTQKDFIKKLTACSVDAILTTNYSLEIEKSVIENYSDYKRRQLSKKLIEGDAKQEKFRLFDYIELPDEKSLWHIHGDAYHINSMIMGHYFYGELLAAIDRCIHKLIKRYKGCKTYKKDFMPKSWLDYFMTGEVHIMGLGMELSEMDLWWLACCKKKNFPDTKIYFYDPLHDNRQRELLMESYGIVPVKDIEFRENYIDYYEAVINRINSL